MVSKLGLWATIPGMLAVGMLGLVPCPRGMAQEQAAIPGPLRGYVVVDDRYEKKTREGSTEPQRDPRDRTAMMHCFVCEHGLNPTVAILTRESATPESAVAALATGLQPLLRQYRPNQLNAFVTFLTLEDEFPADNSRNDQGEFLRDVKAKDVRNLADVLKTNLIPFSLAASRSDAVQAWQMPDDQETLVVLYHKMKIVKKWTLPAGVPNNEELNAILAAVKAEASK